MNVLCTGMSGSGRTSYVNAVRLHAQARGDILHIFDVRDIMFHLARERGDALEEETILDVFPSALGAYRAAAMERILSDVRALPSGEPWLIVTHAIFSWNYSVVPGLDVYYLNQLQPDAYVTITDGILSIRQRLNEERWRRVTVNNLLWWRDIERAATEMMAAWQRKPHYLIGRRQGPDTLYRLIFEAGVPTAYLSYPMTHFEGVDLHAKLEAFRQRLRTLVVVFDPASVDDYTVDLNAAISFSDGSADRAGEGSLAGVGGTSHKTGRARDLLLDGHVNGADGVGRPPNPENLDHVDGQIVDRDYKLIDQAQLVVVYYPTTTLSAGVICEMKDAIHRGKRVYAVWLPSTQPSPFFTRYCTRWFRDEAHLFAYFRATGIGSHPPVAADAADDLPGEVGEAAVTA
jgi:adenylate kinase